MDGTGEGGCAASQSITCGRSGHSGCGLKSIKPCCPVPCCCIFGCTRSALVLEHRTPSAFGVRCVVGVGLHVRPGYPCLLEHRAPFASGPCRVTAFLVVCVRWLRPKQLQKEHSGYTFYRSSSMSLPSVRQLVVARVGRWYSDSSAQETCWIGRGSGERTLDFSMIQFAPFSWRICYNALIGGGDEDERPRFQARVYRGEHVAPLTL